MVEKLINSDDEKEQLFSSEQSVLDVNTLRDLHEKLAKAFGVTEKCFSGLEYQFRDMLANFHADNQRGMSELEWYQFLKKSVDSGFLELEETEGPII